MHFISTTPEELFSHVPDFCSWSEASNWMEEGIEKSKNLTQPTSFTCLDGSIFSPSDSPFGLYISAQWRKFVLTTFLADLICYERSVDQVSFDLLLFVMHRFPSGFRIWWGKTDERWFPVGYSGWLPMLESQFDLFKNQSHKVQSRFVLPVPNKDENPYIYFFNYSVIPSLKKSVVSKELMCHFVKDVQNQHAKGFACIAVSDDGVKFARRFGLECSGELMIEGCTEWIFTSSEKKLL